LTKHYQQHKKIADKVIKENVTFFANLYGVQVKRVAIRNQRTRWGSCSREKSINLSYYLMLLPPHLVDYVILHELCHTKEMNHGDKFWKWMDKVTDGQSKALRRELKTFNMPVL
jgi:predicted metal-dependent hydrolase